MNSIIQRLAQAYNDFPEDILTALIIAAGIVYIIMALTVHEKWQKALILAYATLP